MEIQTAVVVGSGVMGRGIVNTFARGGHDVTLVSRDPSKVAPFEASNIRIVDALPDDEPDFIIESIPEDIDLKHALFADIEARYSARPIVASNTSALPLDRMAARMKHPDRFIGVHYAQPADAFPLVEVIRVAETRDDVLDAVKAMLARNGQGALVVNRPVPGFLINRLQHAMMHEALAMIEDGLCTAEDLDAVMRTMMGPRMSITGLILQKDISGLQTTAATHRSVIPALYHTNKPVALLQDMVAAGDWGMSTGKGFYDWQGRDTAAYKQVVGRKLARLLKFLEDDEPLP
jgi:3-hydroxybutyryl-CoA dehydrogenase